MVISLRSSVFLVGALTSAIGRAQEPITDLRTWGLEDVPPRPVESKAENAQKSRAEQIADYEYWCFGQTTLPQCVNRIIWVEKELTSRDDGARRTGQPDTGNRGLSLMGCYNYCTLKYFPADNMKECKTSISTFRQIARTKPYLWRTDIRPFLVEKCGRF